MGIRPDAMPVCKESGRRAGGGAMNPLGPDLPQRFLEPAGMRWGTHVATDGAQLRWSSLGGQSASAHCVLVGGFSEFIEKYFETAADLAGRGFAVWCMDWRGQGASTRPRQRPHRPRARDYDRDAEDLAGFAASIAGDGRPLVVMGHSMGAAIALLALRGNPRLFRAAILSAPMLALATGRVPADVAYAISTTAVRLGLGHALVPGTRTWPVATDIAPERSRTSSDAIRCRVQPSWFAARPQLRIAGVTFAWLGTAIELCRRFDDPRMLAGITTPVLIGTSGVDHFVAADAHHRAASLLPHCRHGVFADAKHELFMERDAIRSRWLAEIDRFLLDAGLRTARPQARL
jgi:lysophospholipase